MDPEPGWVWYNYDTDRFEPGTTPESDEQAEQYLPHFDKADGGPARKLYRVYREEGASILAALARATEMILSCHMVSMRG